MEDVRATYEDSVRSSEVIEEERKKDRQQFDQELHALRKEQESKVCMHRLFT